MVNLMKKNECSINNISLVSDNWTEKDISKAKGLSCNVFHKPVSPEELFEWIDSCEKNIYHQRVLLKKTPIIHINGVLKLPAISIDS